jgi:adenylyltransferase/sulfurtransferase
MKKLTKEEKERYNKMISLEDMSEEDLLKLKNSSVLVIGAGGLGSGALPVLAASGVGQIGIVEYDKIENNNLQRQTIYNVEDVGESKLEKAAEMILRKNPNSEIIKYNDELNKNNIQSIFKSFDIILDCTDNFNTRYLINDTCTIMNKTLVYASVSEYEGMVSILHHKNKKCLRDLFPLQPEPLNEKGIFPTLPLITGSLQANETLKIIIEKGNTLDGNLLHFNILENTFYIFEL